MNTFDTVIRVLCLAAAITFCVRYSRVNWKHTTAGQHLMEFTLMLSSFLGLVVLARFFPNAVWYTSVSRFLFVWLLSLLIRRNVLFYKAQRENGRPATFDNSIMEEFMDNDVPFVKYAAKAFVGAAMAGVGSAISCLNDGQWTLTDTLTTALSVLGVFAGVFGVENNYGNKQK